MPLPTQSVYFLPLTSSAVAAFLEGAQIPATALERAGLFAAALCQGKTHHSAALTRLIEQACGLFAAHPDAAAAQFHALAPRLPTRLNDWLEALALQGVVLGPEAVVQQFCQLSPDDYPVDPFQAACRTTLEPHTIRFYTDAAVDPDAQDATGGDALQAPAYVERTHDYTAEQARALRAIVANDDEHIDLDAYAGAGKTHLILQLLDSATRRYTYIAPRPSQVQAFRRRLSGALPVEILSQISFANQVAGSAFRQGILGTAYRPTFQISKASFRDIAQRIGLQPIGNQPPTSVLRVAFDGIASWCRSPGERLEPRHFVRALPWAMIDAGPYIAAAEHVWRCMFDPVLQKATLLSLNVDHIGKWLALHGAKIPATWGTLLIDEGHDMSPAWKALLSGYEGSVISLGDPNQRLVGRSPRFATGMKLEIMQSVRQGPMVEQLVNETVALDATGYFDGPFAGSPDQPTLARTYLAWDEVPGSGARVYGNPWRLLEEAQRLAAAGVTFGVHPDTLSSVGREVNRGEEAYREMTSHGGSSQRWEALLAECNEQDMPQIPRMFMRGYNRDRFIELTQRLAAFHEAPLQLMLVEHAKNTEFAQVAMSMCCFRTGFGRGYAHNPVRAAYTAMTRGTQQLWMPAGALDELGQSIARYQASRAEYRRSKAITPGRPVPR